MAQFSAGVIISSLAKTTIRSYNKIIQEFLQWVGSLEPGLISLPVTPLHVSMYMGFLFNKGLSPATISSRLSAIAFWHKLYTSNDPTDHFLVRRTLVGLRKECPQMDPRPPLTLKDLHLLCQGATICDWAPFDVLLFQAMVTLW